MTSEIIDASQATRALRADSDVGGKRIDVVDPASEKIERATRYVEQANSRMLDQRFRSAETMRDIQDRLKAAIDTLNERMPSSAKTLSFSVDEVSNRFMVTVTDQESGQVIRQVPAEAVLRVAHNIEALKGVLFDKVL